MHASRSTISGGIRPAEPGVPSRQVLQRACACATDSSHQACEECRRKEPEAVQRSLGDSRRRDPEIAPPAVHAVLRSPGDPLDSATRSFFEPRFGRDLSGVRVHSDSSAAASAEAVNAAAYTVGRDVVFGAGRYEPSTPRGRTLIAHELTHVVQQRFASSTSELLRVNTPRGDDEIEATATARRVLGRSADSTPSLVQSTCLQRAVLESVVSHLQPGARACLVHLHGDEQNALQAAKSLRASHCVNLVHLTNTIRNIRVTVPSGSGSVTCQADPNRIFTPSGLRSAAVQSPCPASVRIQVRTDLAQFRDQEVAPAIRRCRGSSGGSDLEGPLPIVAFHNNTPGGSLSIRSFQRGGGEAGATELDPARTGGLANPTVVAGQDPNDFLLVTDPADFAALRTTRNTVLQSLTPTTDDGSLSVKLKNDRYINIEAQGKTFVNNTHRFFVTNLAMGRDVLRQLGVGEQPCARDAAGEAGTRAKPAQEQRRDEPSPQQEGEGEGLLDWIGRFVREIIRVLEQVGTMPEPLPRESPPSNLPLGCLLFSHQGDLDAHKSHWGSAIAGMPLADVIGWIVGIKAPLAAATKEATAQRDCMLSAIRTAARTGSAINLPPGGHVQSGRRDFARQRAIWDRKFEFRGQPFDRITDEARRTCGSLIAASDVRWDPGNPAHRVCWGAAPARGTTPPAVPTGARTLTADERQREILQASSAPGISRHHWGTDFDLFDPDMNPAEWQAGGSFADEFSWLMRNAATYGFIQSFTAFSTFMRIGYIEERWHWSYYPIAQALLEFARSKQSDVEAELLRQWGSQPQFSFIRAHWREFMFNVRQRGQF
jgi:hypothetical protein